jgi:hypothetical protein
MTDEERRRCAALLDWLRVQQLWRRPREAEANRAAHASLDEFLKSATPPNQNPETVRNK